MSVYESVHVCAHKHVHLCQGEGGGGLGQEENICTGGNRNYVTLLPPPILNDAL